MNRGRKSLRLLNPGSSSSIPAGTAFFDLQNEEVRKVHAADCWSVWWVKSDIERLSLRQCYAYRFVYLCACLKIKVLNVKVLWLHMNPFKIQTVCLLIGYFLWKQGPFYACGILPNTRFYKSVHIYNLITNTQYWIGKKQEMGLIKSWKSTLSSPQWNIAGCCHLTAMFNCFVTCANLQFCKHF